MTSCLISEVQIVVTASLQPLESLGRVRPRNRVSGCLSHDLEVKESGEPGQGLAIRTAGAPVIEKKDGRDLLELAKGEKGCREPGNSVGLFQTLDFDGSLEGFCGEVALDHGARLS